MVKFFRANAMRFAYAAIGVTVFLAFLIATFPYNDTLTRVLAPTGLRLSSRDQGMNFPFGVRIDDVMLGSKDGGPPVFQSERLRVTPVLLAWLMGSPALHIKADAYGGNFTIRAQRLGEFTQLRFEGANLRLESYPALSAIGLNFGGRLSGAGDASISPDNLMADRGTIHLSASDATYRVFTGMAPLKLGILTAIVKLDSGKVTIEQVESHGGDVSVSGRGVIELDPNLPDSEVAIRFQLELTPAGREQMGFLLNFLPHPPNATPYFLHGTFMSPGLS